MKMEKLKKDQRGFTMIELLVAIAIAGIITGGITAAIMQILTINTRASNHMICVRQVQQAGKEVSKDALQAQNVTYTKDPDFLLTLAWTDWEGSVNQVTYTITEDNELLRSHSVDGLRVIAQYIDPGGTSCACCSNQTGCHQGTCGNQEWLTFNVTAAVGTESETRVYEIDPRVG
jgi:prepilin-type N-terminal cleavage/methylation domain-containing protein